ncbi:hypothetical protein [Streptomyces turgidiscabies]|uniref:Uncharacterized protein n=1 Tax=Streptomyces turgidiscabies TaxID=85558 RepID=A0ABU0RVH4_9ACTN|nr:hypothetical protein [Streptomyces turgidiscabies]MDQ0935997.1 hypothetical protein [Streptomyces turgidiscabies]
MRKKRTPIMLALAGLIASMLTFVSSGTASAAESVPETWYPPVTVNGNPAPAAASHTGPDGSFTIPCEENTSTGGSRDLTTYSATGQVTRTIDRNSYIDGVKNCISSVAIGKNGDIYGRPYGKKLVGTGNASGTNVLAYAGNTLKWKYPATLCMSGPEIGADGNVYLTTGLSDGTHLIGLKPNLDPGKTEPTKVLDVKLSEPKTCQWALRPYGDGIAFRDYASSNGWSFYTYKGKFIDRSPHKSADDVVNVQGQQFFNSVEVYNGTRQGYEKLKVSKYDPRQRALLWTKQVNAEGATAKGTNMLYPVRGGGVATITTEIKLVSPGVPASPITWINKLVYLNGDGLKTEVLLPEADAQGNKYTLDTWNVDRDGKVAILLTTSVASGLSSPTKVNVIDIKVWDITANAWMYQKRMGGDVNASDGLRGYNANHGVVYPPALNKDTLTFTATCSYGCVSTTTKKVYSLKVPLLQMDHLRGDVLTASSVPTQPAPVPYVAMGDSFSAGEGVEPFATSSNTDTNKCHRSDFAYSQVISRDPNQAASLDLGKFRRLFGSHHQAHHWCVDGG